MKQTIYSKYYNGASLRADAEALHTPPILKTISITTSTFLMMEQSYNGPSEPFLGVRIPFFISIFNVFWLFRRYNLLLRRSIASRREETNKETDPLGFLSLCLPTGFLD